MTIENEEPPTLTKYGRMRERYLREHKRVLYFNLLTSGKLYEHLADIDTSACDMAVGYYDVDSGEILTEMVAPDHLMEIINHENVFQDICEAP